MFSKIRRINELSIIFWKMVMVVIHKIEKRPRGRPQVRCDDDTKSLIIEAATAQFHESGYAAASISAIAQNAGVSTKTLYRLFPNKADLFACMISDRIGRFFLAVNPDAHKDEDLREGLERILTVYGTLTFSEDTIDIFRLVIGESDRFPELAASFYERAIVKTNAVMEAWLREQVERGRLALDDPHAASGMLRGMMVMEPQRAAMLRQAPAPGSEEIRVRAKMCADLFLKGCAI